MENSKGSVWRLMFVATCFYFILILCFLSFSLGVFFVCFANCKPLADVLYLFASPYNSFVKPFRDYIIYIYRSMIYVVFLPGSQANLY